LKMKKEVAVLVLATMIFLSTFLIQLPSVSAAYTVQEHCMPPDSDLKPVCAMKTRVNGYFYIPNYDVDVLKIEFLFNYSGLEGDQAGGTSPYSGIANYPDGTVDMLDAIVVSESYGQIEGGARWNYMADVDASKQVDIFDCIIVSDNFGNSGTYSSNLNGVSVVFNTGYQASPDSGGNITIPDGARSFTVYKNGSPIGAMITFWGTRTPPIAYSTTFEFKAPAANESDLYKEVWYYVLARVYVPPELSRQSFYFVATASERVQSVKLNAYSKAGNGSSVNIGLGTLYSGYHLLEFEFVDYGGSGSLNFHVATANGTCAWLDRFRIYVPNYSENEYKYNVKTWTTFSMEDDYYLIGYADDYIEAVHTDGLLWDGWMWNLSSTETIYAWGDGFIYPFGRKDRNYSCEVSFTFGEIWGSGLLDFQVISWTNQTERIGAPKFCAVGNASGAYWKMDDFFEYYGFIERATVYGGSKWNGTTAVSDRFFECRMRVKTNVTEYSVYSGEPTGWGIKDEFEIGLGVGWAEPDLPRAINDMGITINFTVINSTVIHNGEPIPPSDFWVFELSDYSVDVYSYSGLELSGFEFTGTENIESIISPDWTIALDYIGTVIMFVSGELEQPVGAVVGLGMKGIAALTHLLPGQSVPNYTTTISEPHHYRVNATRPLYVTDNFIGSDYTTSAALFFKLDPNVGHTCGLTKIVLRGLLKANGRLPPFCPIHTYPVGVVEMNLYIPWFIW